MLVLASLGSWLPFAIITVIIIFLSITFTLRYQKKRNRDYLVTFVCSVSLIIALLTAGLLPTDVILVSFMKDRNGTFKEWTQNQTDRDHIQHYVELGYYVLYGVVILMAFLINPFLFFYYEEKEDDEKLSKRLCSAIKWTVGFFIFLIILIILGIFVPEIATLPSQNSTSEWDEVKYLVNHFDKNRVKDSIAFAIFTLSIIGFLLLTIYTGYGSIALPISLLRGKRNVLVQQEAIETQRAEIESQIRAIKSRYPRVATMPSRERDRLEILEQKNIALTRNEDSIRIVRRSCFYKCRILYRPFQIFFGFLFLLMAILIFISLLLSNISKCIHFVSFKQIFAHGNKTLPNPIDIILTWTGQVYPISYIFLCGLILYIIFTSLFGLQQLGIWYFWVRMYRFSRGRTKAQAIILLSSLMMFIVVAINIFVYLLIPQYSIYGDQYYLAANRDGSFTKKTCTQYETTDNCQTTVMGRILLQFFYKVWIFGAIYFCVSWLYLVVFVFSFVMKIVRKGESNIQEFSIDRLLEDEDIDEERPLIQ